jgi:polysaccharide biosynthesis transport protein
MNDISPWRVRRRFPENDEIEPEYSYGSQQDELQFSHYWSVLVKYRRSIIALFLLVFVFGSYLTISTTKLYTSSATLKIEPQNPQVTGVGALQPLESISGPQYDYHQTQFALLRSRPLAARVIIDLDLETNKAFTEFTIVSQNPFDHARLWFSRLIRGLAKYVAPLIKSDPKSDEVQINSLSLESMSGEAEEDVAPYLIDRYLGLISITPVENTRLVKVIFTTPNPTLSEMLATAHARNFMKMSLESRFTMTKEARNFLDQKKAEFRQRMEKSEAALNNFRRAHGVVSVDKGENIVVDRLVELNRQLTAARAQRIEAESLNRTVENKNNQDLAEVMRQGLVQQLKGNISNLEAEKVRLDTIFKADHPRIQELSQHIARARQALDNEVANVVRGIRSNYAAAVAKERALETETYKQQQDALKLKEVGVDYTLLQEEVNADRSLYENVLKRLSETNVSNDLAVSNIQLVEKAEKPLTPSYPNTPSFLLTTMFAGLLFGVATAFIREYLDSTLGTPSDVWRAVGLGTLGVVPHFKFLNARTYGAGLARFLPGRGPKSAAHEMRTPAKQSLVSQSPISIASESYRSIRTSLLLSQAGKPPQVILLTSPLPGEGKTVTALNLAAVLAQDGYSVLLMDGDMRKGCCHERLGLGRNGGLSNILTGGIGLQDGIQQTSIDRLSLLSRGAPPPNPSELLGSRIMKETLKDLREIYDFILIDSPPIVGISDAAILSGATDGVLLILDGQSTSTFYAQKAVERLDMVRARLLGVVLNGVNLQHPYYSYLRSYDSYYSNGLTSEYGPAEAISQDHHTSYEENNGTTEAELRKPNRHRHSPKSSEVTLSTGNFKDVSPAIFSDVEGARAGLEMVEVARANFGGDSVWTNGSSDRNQNRVVNVLSRGSLHQVIEALRKTIGPIASTIVHEHISALGESRYDFPASRMDELVRSIEGAMTAEELKLFSKYYLQPDSHV